MSALLLGVFTVSFLGSLHCAGMCGPLVGAYVGAGEVGRGAWLAGHGLYQLGRLLTLLVIGAVAGALGTGVDVLGQQAGLQRGVAVAAGALMVLWGALAIARGKVDLARLPGGSTRGLGGLVTRLLGRAGRASPLRRALALGALTPFLPCGWLWLHVVAAAGTGHPAAGAAVLAAFWAGNTPTLLGVGIGLQTALRGLRPRLPALSGALLIVLGAGLIVQRAAVRPPATPARGAPPTVEAQKDLPCCHEP